MGNCKDCKHWADKAWDEGELIVIVDSAGRAPCIAIDTTREREDEEPGERAVVVAFGMGDGLLRTRGDFGCVLFEPKESDAPVVPQGCPDERGHDLEGGDICVYCGLDAARVEAQTRKP